MSRLFLIKSNAMKTFFKTKFESVPLTPQIVTIFIFVKIPRWAKAGWAIGREGRTSLVNITKLNIV